MYVTMQDLEEAVRTVLAALTTSDRTGLLDRQMTLIEQLAARVEVLELELQLRRSSLGSDLHP